MCTSLADFSCVSACISAVGADVDSLASNRGCLTMTTNRSPIDINMAEMQFVVAKAITVELATIAVW